MDTADAKSNVKLPNKMSATTTVIPGEKGKYPFNRYVENRRVEMSVMDTLTIRVQREKAVQVAKNLLTMNLNFQDIAQVAELSVEEVERIAEGEDIMENYIWKAIKYVIIFIKKR